MKLVSPAHAMVSFQERSWIVEDMGSARGTLFRGKRVNRVVLATGDIFQIRDYTFRFTEADIHEVRDQFYETMTIL